MLKHGVKNKLLASNPIKDIAALPEKRVKQRRALTQAEASELLRVATERWRRVWFFLLSTGLRRTELVFLRWQDVDLNAATITVREREGWKPKSDGSKRTIPLGEEIVEMLREIYKERSKQSGIYVFETIYVYTETDKKNDAARRRARKRKGLEDIALPAPEVGKFTPLRNNVNKKFKNHMRAAFLVLAEKAERFKEPLPRGVTRAGKKLEVDLSDLDVHSLRYTYITELIARGVDPKTVQYLAGHKDIKTTLGIYAQYRPDKARSAVEVLPWSLKEPDKKVISLASAG